MDTNEIVEILDPLQQIGRGVEGNGKYQRLLAETIKDFGQPITTMTIGAVLDLITKASAEHNNQRYNWSR